MERDSVAAALPDYDVGRELGRGTWGVVVEATIPQTGRRVVVLKLLDAYTAHAEVRDRFSREAPRLASLDHPHVVPVIDHIGRDGGCLLVTELLEGGTLADRVDAKVAPEAACAMAVDAAAA